MTLLLASIAAGLTGTATAPQIRAGKVRAIATAGPIRNRELPEVPTFTELGMQNMVLENWNAFYAPKGLPKAVFERLTDAIQG